MLTLEIAENSLAEVDQVIAEANEQFLNDEYRNLLNEYEQITKLLLDELTATIEARYDIGSMFPAKWRQSLRRQGEAVLRSPSLIQCAAAPSGYETLSAMYGDWACYCEALGNRVLEFVSELENESPFGCPSVFFDYVLQALSAAEAHSSARGIYIKGVLGTHK
jgi:hypothetical protein